MATPDASNRVTFPLAAALASGALLYAAFPPLEWAGLAWVALTPLLWLCHTRPPRVAARWGFLTGAVFWLGTLHWITHVTYAGWIALSLYCALYMGLFAGLAAWWSPQRGAVTRAGRDATGYPLLSALGTAVCWTGLEFMRSVFLTGFPWNPLGVSQFKAVWLIQCAAWGGAYLVSFGLVFCNALLAHAFRFWILDFGFWNRETCLPPDESRKGMPAEGIAAVQQSKIQNPKSKIVWLPGLTLLAVWLGSGAWLAREPAAPGGVAVRVAAIQPNIPQVHKWAEAWIADSQARVRRATTAAVREARPDLIVWPETVVPDFVRYEGAGRALVLELLDHGVPLLVGSMDYDAATPETRYYNSAFLFEPEPAVGPDASLQNPTSAMQHPPSAIQNPKSKIQNGASIAPQRYDKRHLVMFGEYIPLDGLLPFVRALTPIEDSFTAGATSTVFRLRAPPCAFSVLICFEDAFPRLALLAVRHGARLLINQTNDAWFDPTRASRQHLAQGVFRSVENRVPTVRAANTGVTGFIDARGRLHGLLPAARGVDDDPAFSVAALHPPPETMPLTFYTRHGDVFAGGCLALTALAALRAVRRRRAG